jgi:peptidyl-tRNA hydrolase, PTH1 family
LKLIVGLGNPGQSYSGNRHNIGFMCLNYFAREHHILFNKKKGDARVGEGEVVGVPVVLARPQTYMNASGKAVGKLLDKLKLTLDDLIVIHDDLDLPLGRIRIRRGGSSGGHKGIESIIQEVGSPDFIRVRVGTGRPPKAECGVQGEKEIIDYVLSGFNEDERPVIEKTIPRASEAVRSLLSESLETAMNRYNPIPNSKNVQEERN